MRAPKTIQSASGATLPARRAVLQLPHQLLRAGALILLAAVFSAACGAPQAPEPATPAVSLELEARIGCVDCDDERQITPISVALLAGDRVGVLDLYEPFVRIFDAGGALEVAFGQKGQGPGEIGMDLPGVGIYQPGIWLIGNPQGGATVIGILPVALDAFDSSGAFLGKTTVDLPMAVPVAQAFDRGTGTYFQHTWSPGESDSDRAIWRCRLPPAAPTGCTQLVDPRRFLEPEGSPGSLGGDLALAATLDGRLALANVDTYRIWVLDDNAEVVTQTFRDIPRPPKSEEELAADRDTAARLGRPESSVDPNRPHILPRGGIQVDDGGRIWALTARYADADTTFDVFAPDGSYLAEVVIDAAVRPSETAIALFVVDGDRLAAVARQPDGDEQVWVWRIVSS